MTIDGAYHMGSFSGAVCTPIAAHDHERPDALASAISPGAKQNPKLCPPALEQNTIAAVFNSRRVRHDAHLQTGNSYEAANRMFTVRRDDTKRGGTDETGSAWHAEQVLDYLRQREKSNDQDPFFIHFGFSHPHDTRDGKPELLAKYGAVNHEDQAECTVAQRKSATIASELLAGSSIRSWSSGLRDEVDVSGVWERRDEATIRNELGRQFACSRISTCRSIASSSNLNRWRTEEHLHHLHLRSWNGDWSTRPARQTELVPTHVARSLIVAGPGIAPGSRLWAMSICSICSPRSVILLVSMLRRATRERVFKGVLFGERPAIRDVLYYGAYCAERNPACAACSEAMETDPVRCARWFRS